MQNFFAFSLQSSYQWRCLLFYKTQFKLARFSSLSEALPRDPIVRFAELMSRKKIKIWKATLKSSPSGGTTLHAEVAKLSFLFTSSSPRILPEPVTWNWLSRYLVPQVGISLMESDNHHRQRYLMIVGSSLLLLGYLIGIESLKCSLSASRRDWKALVCFLGGKASSINFSFKLDCNHREFMFDGF